MYKEVNPAVFAIVTFPFLFAVMFGDIGHGGMFLILGTLMCLFNGAIQKTSMASFNSIRYLVLLMGFFAFYNGWIYNEFFAMPLEVFGSCYEEAVTVLSNQANSTLKDVWDPLDYGHKRIENCTYTFGIDPRWI